MTHLLALLLASGCAAPGPSSTDDSASDDTAADTGFDDTAPDRSIDDTPPCDALGDPWTAITAEEVMAAYRYAPRDGNADPLSSYESGFPLLERALGGVVWGCPSVQDDSEEGGQFYTVDEGGCTTDDGDHWSGWGQIDLDPHAGGWFGARALRLETVDYTDQLDGAYDFAFDDVGGQSFRTNSAFYFSYPAQGVLFERTWIGHGEEEEYGAAWEMELYVHVTESSAGVAGDYCVTETRTEGTTDGTEWTDVVGASVARIVWTGAEGCGDVTIDGVAVGSACR